MMDTLQKMALVLIAQWMVVSNAQQMPKNVIFVNKA
jgi:hypothetical protein